jgi:8-oxo-dGTP pyrophosphatase MutT (NUDIX family)
MDFAESYIGKMRNIVGSRLLIHPAARIIIENNKGEFLFIERTDNGHLGLPAGGLEENETIWECIKREAKEEAGIEVKNVKFIGLSTQPETERTLYPNGDVTQYFTAEFYTNQFSGVPFADGKESKSVDWYASAYIDKLPVGERSTFESLALWKETGRVNVR